MANEIRINGIDALNRELKALENNVRKNIVKSGLRAAGAVVRKKARTNLRGEYKRFVKAIQVKLLRPRSPFTMTAIVGAGKHKGKDKQTGETKTTDFWFAHIVEFGTLGSRTKPLSKRTQRKKHRSPLPKGLRMRPFLRPAFDSSKQLMINAFSKKVWERIRKEHIKL